MSTTPTESAERAALEELVAAAQAVVDRWDTPVWKDAPHTGEFIARLRVAVAALAAPSPASTEVPQCNPTLTECPRCKNVIGKCDGMFAPSPAEVPAEPVAWMMKSGHGTAFKEKLSAEHRELTFGGRPMWRPLIYASPLSPQAVPQGWKLVPVEPTPEMVAAYLAANNAYWTRVDAEGPPPIGVWRNGTPAKATAESYRAMLAAAPQHPGKEG